MNKNKLYKFEELSSWSQYRALDDLKKIIVRDEIIYLEYLAASRRITRDEYRKKIGFKKMVNDDALFNPDARFERTALYYAKNKKEVDKMADEIKDNLFLYNRDGRAAINAESDEPVKIS